MIIALLTSLFVIVTTVLVAFLRKYLPGLGVIAKFIDRLSQYVAMEDYAKAHYYACREKETGGEVPTSELTEDECRQAIDRLLQEEDEPNYVKYDWCSVHRRYHACEFVC